MIEILDSSSSLFNPCNPHCPHSVCCHFAVRYEWIFFLNLNFFFFFRDEIICLQVIKFSNCGGKFEITVNFFKKKLKKIHITYKIYLKNLKFLPWMYIICITSWYKPKLSCHSKIKKINQPLLEIQSSYQLLICYKILKFIIFSKFPIRVETTLDELHFISRTQIQKSPFLWLKFTSRLNSKK